MTEEGFAGIYDSRKHDELNSILFGQDIGDLALGDRDA
jgi:hypothetical protein